MNNTPNSNRKHIGIYGKANVGKSSIINKLLNQDISLVSKVKGTTTDPVLKAMELLPIGPVLFIDTAGIDDTSELSKLRINKTLEMLTKTDFAIYVIDSLDIDLSYYEKMKLNFKKFNIPHLLVFNKIDKLSDEDLKNLKDKFRNAQFISTTTDIGIDIFKNELIENLKHLDEELPLIGDLLSYNDNIILVVPIDSEAPKGRLILPQVQCIRECLDYGAKAYVVRDTELEYALNDITDVKLVITDSQAFKKVSSIVNSSINLTSFSILFARQKGDLNTFIEGAKSIKFLNDKSKVLICENCTHNTSHEDIGRIKIPNMINKFTNLKLQYDFKSGCDFPLNIKDYDLVIHCGGCMVNRKTIINRIALCKEQNVPITNYGILIAYITGILNRATNMLIK